MANIIYSIIICISLFSISCYTIIETTPPKKSNPVYNNHKIVGVWDTKVLLRGNKFTLIIGKNNSNSTWITQRLDFFNDGNLVFYSHWEKIDSKVCHGTFTILNNTIKIKLFNASEETYSYKADDKNLILIKNDTGYKSYDIITGYKPSVWTRVN